MKQLSFLQLVITTLLAMTVLYTTNAFAKVYMGKITLEVGDTYEVSAVPTSGYTASGSFSKSGTCFTITANGSYYCKIEANYVGKGTLSYWGSVAPSGSWSTYICDYYWDIEVKSTHDSEPDPEEEEEIDVPKDDWCKTGNYSISWYNKEKTDFTINTNKELAGVAYLVNNGYTTFKDATIRLGADIDLDGRGWVSIGVFDNRPFEGSFDGQGHTISGIYVACSVGEQSYYGLFGKAWKNTYNNNANIIKNVKLQGEINISLVLDWNNQYSGKSYVGGLVGYCNAKIERCICYMPIKYSISNEKEHNNAYIGGIAGYHSNAIDYCLHHGDISYTDRKNTVTYECMIGGIVGKHSANNSQGLSFCENLSDNITIESSGYTAGWKNVKVFVGGIVGDESSSNVLCSRSIIDNMSFSFLDGYKKCDCKVHGICGSPNIKNCYSVISKIKEKNSSNCMGDFTVISKGEASFVNSDIDIDMDEFDLLNKNEASTSFSSGQMKTAAFLEDLNVYSTLNMGGHIWTLPDEGGYPYITALYEPTGIKPVFSVGSNATPIFSLSGQRLAAPKKGINIIGGKKVVVK